MIIIMCVCQCVKYHHHSFQSEKDSKEEILKAFKLFDDDETVSAEVNQSTAVTIECVCVCAGKDIVQQPQESGQGARGELD